MIGCFQKLKKNSERMATMWAMPQVNYSTPCHCHFFLLRNEVRLDPSVGQTKQTCTCRVGSGHASCGPHGLVA